MTLPVSRYLHRWIAIDITRKIRVLETHPISFLKPVRNIGDLTRNLLSIWIRNTKIGIPLSSTRRIIYLRLRRRIRELWSTISTSNLRRIIFRVLKLLRVIGLLMGAVGMEGLAGGRIRVVGISRQVGLSRKKRCISLRKSNLRKMLLSKILQLQ